MWQLDGTQLLASKPCSEIEGIREVRASETYQFLVCTDYKSFSLSQTKEGTLQVKTCFPGFKRLKISTVYINVSYCDMNVLFPQ
jgi:hypothetical protein